MNNQSTMATHSASPCGFMLRMARTWQARGQINQAIDAYSRLMTRYPASAEACEAADRLLALAQDYERHGQYRLALGLYEKLERLQ